MTTSSYTYPRPILDIQRIVGVPGEYGPATTEAVRAYQTTLGAYVDGIWGPATEKAHLAHIQPVLDAALQKTIAIGARTVASIITLSGGVTPTWNEENYNLVLAKQREIGTTADGIWGRATETAFVRYLAVDSAYSRGMRVTRLTLPEVAQVAKAAGFTGEGLVNAVCVAIAESGSYRGGSWGCDPIARLVNLGTVRSIDRGVWQINDYWHPEVIDWKADTPALAAKEAYRISKQGTDWNAWSTWKNGSAQARRSLAINAINGS